MICFRNLGKGWPGCFSAPWDQWGRTLGWEPPAQGWLTLETPCLTTQLLPPRSCSVVSPHLEESLQCFPLVRVEEAIPEVLGQCHSPRCVKRWVVLLSGLTCLRNIPILSGKELRVGIFAELLKIVQWGSRKVKIKQKHQLDLSDILDIFGEKNRQTRNLLVYVVTKNVHCTELGFVLNDCSAPYINKRRGKLQKAWRRASLFSVSQQFMWSLTLARLC